MSAVMGSQIHNDKRSIRKTFSQILDNMTRENQTIAGMPIMYKKLSKVKRVFVNELTIFNDMYGKSIFCPCLRGDGPAQKRIFDVWMSGCIPVVLKYNTSHETSRRGQLGGGSGSQQQYPTFFAPKLASIRVTYPYSRGIFVKYQNSMGINYQDLVVMINADEGDCGLPCIKDILKDYILNKPNQIQKIRQKIRQYARLFSFGMEHNALQYPDAIVAMLVQARHYVNHL